MVPNMVGAAPSNTRNENHVSTILSFVLTFYHIIDSATREPYRDKYSFFSVKWKQEIPNSSQQHACRHGSVAKDGKWGITSPAVIFF